MMLKRSVVFAVALAASLSAPVVMAGEGGGVSFSRNRLVYPSGTRAIQISVNNHGTTPYLVQAGVSGDPAKKTPAPFVVTPPLFRLEGQGQNDIRIMAAAGGLPQDRESVFYFYGTAIPGGTAGPESKESGATLSFAMRTVLKLFWRPAGLKPSPEAAPGKMQFTRDAQGVLVTNPTPYYQSFARLEFDGQPQRLDSVPSMVAPFGTLHFDSSRSVTKVSWQVMNDYGGTTPLVTQPLSTTGAK